MISDVYLLYSQYLHETWYVHLYMYSTVTGTWKSPYSYYD